MEDQNGDRCALIRVQTTQKGFVFEGGSLGIQRVDDNHVGEIWVWVSPRLRHISIRHSQLGSLSNYEFPINIEEAKTYTMEITSDKVFVNYYDDTRKQKLHIRVSPPEAVFTLNGMNIPLDKNGEATQKLSFGTYTYKVKEERYYPKEGQITINDSVNMQQLVVDDLKPIMGKLSVHVNPYNAEIIVDGKTIPSNTALEPFALQIGMHRLTIKSNGYKTEEQNVLISKYNTTEINVKLGQVANFYIQSTPTGATVSIDGKEIDVTPCVKALTTGTYEIWVKKSGYKDYKKRMVLSSSEPSINVRLGKIYNYKNGMYVEAGGRIGSFTAFGGSLGCYISNINIEMSAFYGNDKSETVYWSGNGKEPVSSLYYPQISMCGKVGYGFPVGTRFRLTPQIGANYLRIKEKMQTGANANADESIVVSAAFGLRFSAVIVNHFGISLSPEYSIAVGKSNGYKALENVSPKIKKWGEGLNVKLGLMVTF